MSPDVSTLGRWLVNLVALGADPAINGGEFGLGRLDDRLGVGGAFRVAHLV